jgi:outer membrane receptor for ferric coprogen and ferric-rhodotorulic acid
VGIFNLRDEDRALADPENPGFYLNAGEIESKGWEMEVVGAPVPGLDLQLGYSRLDASFRIASANLVGLRFSTLEPKHTWKLWAVHRIDSTASSGFAFGGGLNYQSGIESAPRRQGGYTIANAMAEYRFNDHASATLNASNIFDKVYYARVGATNTYNTFGVPRNYSIRLNVTF